MRCHYEVLGVERTADAATLKSAYRRLALLTHPDKCKEADAEARFREVQAAFECLQDVNQRAWYDSHRDAILRDEDPDSNASSAGVAPPTEFSLFPYFRGGAFAGFGTDARSFYAVYGVVFARLAAQEANAAEAAGKQWRSPPVLGHSATPYTPAVAAFYDFWLGFTTLKEFAWLDQYNPSDAEGRKQRRLMEDENRRLRRAAQREHSDAVRQLAAHVRGCDPRYRERRVQAEAAAAHRAAAAAAKKVADAAARAAARAAAAAAEAEEEEPEWMAAELAAASRGKSRAAEGDDAEDGGLFCPVCRKGFRSQAQWDNHERSKKHLEAVAAIRREMIREERAARKSGKDTAQPAAEEEAEVFYSAGEEAEEAEAATGSDTDSDGEAVAAAAAAAKAAKKKAAKAAKRRGPGGAAFAVPIASEPESEGEEAPATLDAAESVDADAVAEALADQATLEEPAAEEPAEPPAPEQTRSRAKAAACTQEL